jgi:hypothetical protein
MKLLSLVYLSLFLFACSSKPTTQQKPEIPTVILNSTEAQKVSGVDINGKPRSCAPSSGQLICTMMFAPGDQFAADCKKNGDKPIQCGCHDFICVKKKKSGEY